MKWLLLLLSLMLTGCAGAPLDQYQQNWIEAFNNAASPEIMERVVPRSGDWTLHWIEHADHSYDVKKISGRTRSQVADEMREATTVWLGNF